MTLCATSLHQCGYHDDQRAALLHHHLPEVSHRRVQGPCVTVIQLAVNDCDTQLIRAALETEHFQYKRKILHSVCHVLSFKSQSPLLWTKKKQSMTIYINKGHI